MPRRYRKKSNRPLRGKRVMPYRRRGRILGFRNRNPVFTESYVLSQQIAPNSGNTMTFNMTQVPQLAQYSNLYQKYRILKARVILLPQYTGQDENQAEYNGGNNVFVAGMGRLVWAQNDSPNLPPPTSEGDVLRDNGCKIVPVRTKVTMGCKPVPGTLDANGVEMTFKKKYINFAVTNVAHYGINYWYSQPTLGTTASVNNSLWVYIKLTFQLADPR